MAASNDTGSLSSRWDILVAVAGLAALAAAAFVAFSVYGTDPDDAIAEAVDEIGTRSSSDTGVKPVDMKIYYEATRAIANPPKIAEIAETQGSFLASGRRVFCEQGDAEDEKKSCGRPIPFGSKVCPICGAKQPEEIKVVLDTDGDGMSDEYEKSHGLDPARDDRDDDFDGDGFSNIEEFEAGTSPSDPEDHPDYLDFVRLVPPLENTSLPFYLERVAKLPASYRYFFRDPKKRNDYGKPGVVYSVEEGKEIGSTGYIAQKYVQKSKKVKIEGSNVTREVDDSTATVVRKSDKREIELKIGSKRLVPVDMKAKLYFERDGGKEYTVEPGTVIDIRGGLYTVREIAREGKTAKVVLESQKGVRRTFEALEQ